MQERDAHNPPYTPENLSVPQTDNLDHLLINTLEEPWYRSLINQIRDLVNPKPEPPLVVTSTPIPVKDIWGQYRYGRQAAASSLVTHGLIIALLVTAFAHPKVQEIAKHGVSLILPTDLSPYLPVAPPKPTPIGDG